MRTKEVFRRFVSVVTVLFLSAQLSVAEPVSPDEEILLVSSNDEILFYKLDGELVGRLAVPYPDGARGSEYIRDLHSDENGDIYVFNGITRPYLSKYEAASGQWSHLTIDGWDIPATTNFGPSHGHIAKLGPYIFAHDLGEFPRGIIRFDFSTGSVERFWTGWLGVMDVAADPGSFGLPRLIYMLDMYPKTSGNLINGFYPDTMSLTVQLPVPLEVQDPNLLLIDKSGDYFVFESRNRRIWRLDKNARVIKSAPTFHRMLDAVLTPQGRLLVGGELGQVSVYDRSLTIIKNIFTEKRVPVFVSYTTSKAINIK